MNDAAFARQATGAERCQTRDAESASGSFPAQTALSARFFEANLEHLRLPPLTLDAVRTAESLPELESQHGTPLLKRDGVLFGAPPEDADLRRSVSNDPDAVFVVFGLGLGETARALRAHTESPIIVFEPDAGILRRVLELGPSDLSGFDIVCNTHDLTQIWPAAFASRKSAILIHSSGYGEAFPDASAHLRATLAELVQRSRVNHETHRLRARDWVSDVLANVELLSEHPGFLALAGKYRGVPAFIVGAGPSLGKNGRHLVQAQKKGIVFAVNSSARALDRLGVEPHVLSCMESIDVSHLLRDVGFIDRAIRAFSLSAHPNTFRTGAGPMLPIWEGIAQLAVPLQRLSGLPGLPVSGSVSTLVFALAQRLGCSPIVFVGQDLAYTDGRAYAPGSVYEDSRVSRAADGRSIRMEWCDTLKATHKLDGHTMHESEPLTETIAWGGTGRVVSSIAFSAVRAWLESAAVVLARESEATRLVNATEGGARIAGFEERELAELLAELPDLGITVESILNDAHAAAPPLARSRIAEWATAEAEATSLARHSARRIRRLAEATLSAARHGDPQVTRRLARLDAAEKDLRQRVAQAPFLDAWSWGDVDRLMQTHQAPGADAQAAANYALAFEARFGAQIDACARKLEYELRQLGSRLRQTKEA